MNRGVCVPTVIRQLRRRAARAGVPLLIAILSTPATAQVLPPDTPPQPDSRAVVVSPPISPHVFEDDLRTLPTVRPWQPGDPVKEGPRRRNTHPQSATPMSQPSDPEQRDPLLDRQPGTGTQGRTRRSFSPPDLNFDGQGFTGVVPPDPVGAVGPHHYIQLVNSAGGSQLTVFDKATGGVVAGPSMLSALWVGSDACTVGFGDGIVLFDQLASRWFMAEFADQSRGNHLCVYVSKTSNPVTGGWLNYDFTVGEFPDYPKYAVWPDAYYVSTNESAPAAYALDRTQMLAGLPATYQRFTASSLSGFSFQALTPSDLDGSTPPPAGAPNFFMRHRDDELHNPGANDPAHDFLEIWPFHADFATPANSTFGLGATIPVAEFNSALCVASPTSSCFPQPAGGTPLDPIREVIMWRLQYRNFGGYETLVGNFVTDVDGTNHGGIRWFELRRVGVGAWSLFQEGTYAPDANNRWLGSMAMDGSGNMALGFSITSATVFPGIRYTGRTAADPAGTMTVAETTIMDGAGVQDSERWGDYSSLNVDPVDNCTLWYTNEYVPASGLWQTRIARFRFPSPTCVDTPAPICGNSVKEVGEDCDGSDASACPGLCQSNCTCSAPVCGNNVVEVGEQCDGTSASTCATGTCRANCTCALCGATPSTGCLTTPAHHSSLLVRDVLVDAYDVVRWNWKNGADTALRDFADPVHGAASYAFCIYDTSANPQPLMDAMIPPGGTCGRRPCWKQTTRGDGGYLYFNPAATPQGVRGVTLKAGVGGTAAVVVAGLGVHLESPHPALTLPVTAQLVIRNGATTKCWQTQYLSATLNSATQFIAHGP